VRTTIPGPVRSTVDDPGRAVATQAPAPESASGPDGPTDPPRPGVARRRPREPRRGRRAGLVAGALILLLLVSAFAYAAGRGADGSGSSNGPNATVSGGTAATAPEAGARSSAGAADVAAPGFLGGPPASPPGQTGGTSVPVTSRDLVRNATLGLDVDDPAATARKIRTAAAAAGGTVADETSSDSGSHLSLRIPTAKLDTVIDELAALGHVTTRSGSTVDVTEDAVDLDARVASQRASVERVRALLAQAKSIGDVVSIESELTRREADLDSLTNRLTALRGQVALATLTVDVGHGAAIAPPPAPGGFLGGLAAGWDGLRALGAGVGAVAGFVLPFLPVLALLGAIAWFGRRLVRARHAQRRAEA
jgi:Domain of unknown function (DUF4349)